MFDRHEILNTLRFALSSLYDWSARNYGCGCFVGLSHFGILACPRVNGRKGRIEGRCAECHQCGAAAWDAILFGPFSAQDQDLFLNSASTSVNCTDRTVACLLTVGSPSRHTDNVCKLTLKMGLESTTCRQSHGFSRKLPKFASQHTERRSLRRSPRILMPKASLQQLRMTRGVFRVVRFAAPVALGAQLNRSTSMLRACA